MPLTPKAKEAAALGSAAASVFAYGMVGAGAFEQKMRRETLNGAKALSTRKLYDAKALVRTRKPLMKPKI